MGTRPLGWWWGPWIVSFSKFLGVFWTLLVASSCICLESFTGTRHKFSSLLKVPSGMEPNLKNGFIPYCNLLFWWNEHDLLVAILPRPRVISGGGDGTGLGLQVSGGWRLAFFFALLFWAILFDTKIFFCTPILLLQIVWGLDERWWLLQDVGGCIDSMDLRTKPGTEKPMHNAECSSTLLRLVSLYK